MSLALAYLAGLVTTPVIVLIILGVRAIRSPMVWNSERRKNQ